MNKLINSLRLSWQINKSRYAVYLSLLLVIGTLIIFRILVNSYASKELTLKANELITFQGINNELFANFYEIDDLINQAKELSLDTQTFEEKRHLAWEQAFKNKNSLVASKLLSELKDEINLSISERKAQITKQEEQKKSEEEAARQRAVEEEASKGTLTGKVISEYAPLASAKVILLNGRVTVASTLSDRNGDYTIKAKEGKYTLRVTKSNYQTVQKENVIITRQAQTTENIFLAKSPPLPPLQEGAYRRETIKTSRGDYLADIVEVSLSKVRLITDTANDDDCSNNCPTLTLADYVLRNGGFAGINGSYFCPPDYSWCAGKTNSYWVKVYNTRLKKWINGENGMGIYEPLFVFNENSVFNYFGNWAQAKTYSAVYSGIRESPVMRVNSTSPDISALLDSKQKTVKSNRGAFGVKEDNLFLIVVKGATILDSQAVCESLGLDYAMNLDGGGSSALYYNGYKVGPGRRLPNAIVVAWR